MLPTTPQGWFRFVGGRNRLHRIKKQRAMRRQLQIQASFCKGELDWATTQGRTIAQRTLAVKFGVTDRTIRNDIRVILSKSPICPLCGQDVPDRTQMRKKKS